MLSVKEIVKSRLKQALTQDADAPYTEETLHMTSMRTGVPTEFPALNVDSIGETSTGEDLERTQQNAIISTVELKAYTDTAVEDACEILDKAGDVMIAMGYSVIYGPEDVSDTTHIMLARFRRTFGDEDIKNLGGN